MSVTAYTDGSCQPNPGRGGYGAVLLHNNQTFYLQGCANHTTNNRMELMAVLEALRFLPFEKEFDIYSDSLNVVNCAQGIWKRKANLDLWTKYDQLTKDKTIHLTWVRGHDGDHYNEIAHNLAHKAASQAKLK